MVRHNTPLLLDTFDRAIIHEARILVFRELWRLAFPVRGSGGYGSLASCCVCRCRAVAVMGDSISAGSGVTGGSPNWVAQLKSTFPGAITFQNEAVSGVTTNSLVAINCPPW